MKKQYGGDIKQKVDGIQQGVDINTPQILELQQEIRDLKQRVQQLVPEEVRKSARTNFKTLGEGVIDRIAGGKKKNKRKNKKNNSKKNNRKNKNTNKRNKNNRKNNKKSKRN